MKKPNRLAIYSAMAGINLNSMFEDYARKASNGRSKYQPHQGKKECARRLRQMEKQC